MIFQRSLLREVGNYAAAVFSVLFAITVTSQLVRMLARAAGGKLPSDAILALLGFTALNYLPILFALTLFVSVLMAVSRSYRDSEMVVWSASGLPLTAWVKPVLIFAAPIVLLITLLALFLTPWANGKGRRVPPQPREPRGRRAHRPGRVPRVRRTPSGCSSSRPSTATENVVRNVFIASNKRGRSGVTVSREGFIESAENGDRFAVLLNGRQYDGIPGTGEYRVTEFERYAARIKAKEARAASQRPKTASTLELLESRDRELRAELMWRIGLPLVALNLSLLAIPLAFVNPRASRSVNLIFAVFAYMVYSNLLSIVQAWVAQGRVRFEVGWWVLHVGDARPDRVPVPLAQHPRVQALAAAMRTITRYLAREIYKATAFVFLAFLSLFMFFDLINELDDVGKGGYRLVHAFALRPAVGGRARLRALPDRGAHRHAGRAVDARGEQRVHGDARLRPVAAAGGGHARPHRHGVRAACGRLRRARRTGVGAGGAAPAARPPRRLGQLGPPHRAVGQVGHAVREHRRGVARRHA